jgi:hypothetical protein
MTPELTQVLTQLAELLSRYQCVQLTSDVTTAAGIIYQVKIAATGQQS